MKKKFKFLRSLLACTLLSSIFTFGSKAAEEIKTENPKKDLELVFVIDRSGSMSHLEEDTIGNFNSVIKSQKESKNEGNVYVTTVMFNEKNKKIHDRKDIKDVEDITHKDYRTRGTTALLDAVGTTINDISNNKSVKDHKVLFVIITDGYENSSKEFKKEDIKKLIDKKTKEEKWEFKFYGANIDAFSEGSKIGISEDHTINFCASPEGMRKVFDNIGYSIDSARE